MSHIDIADIAARARAEAGDSETAERSLPGALELRASAPDLAGLLCEHLRAPVANIKSAALTLHASARRWEPGAVQEMLRLITREAEGLHEALALAEELRQLQRPAPLRLSPVELSDLLMGTLAAWKALAPGHLLELALPGEVPPITGDEARVKRLFDVLIDQATRHSPAGGTVRVDIHPYPDEVVVSVRHHGHALTGDALAHFFEPFYHHAAAPGTLVGGGLGLALADAIVAAHGGRAWAETPTSGPGTVMSIALPIVPPALLAPPEPVATTPPTPPEPVARPRVRPVVLVLDGEIRMQRYLRANLEAQQYRALVAGDATEAERLIDRDDPDVILLDSQLPGGPFLEVLRHLLDYTHAPIVVLARRHDPTECAQALDLGAMDYLARPLSIDELLARLRVALRTRAALVGATTREPVFERDGLVIDFERRAVSVNEKLVALSKTEFKLLRVLAQHPTMVLSHEVLLERVWGPGYCSEVEFVWVYIRRLRRKIEPDPSHPRYVLTVPGVGYRLG